MPMEVKTDETVPTVNTPRDRLDYQTAVVDPSDDLAVWMISEFADKADSPDEEDGYRTVVGKVTP